MKKMLIVALSFCLIAATTQVNSADRPEKGKKASKIHESEIQQGKTITGKVTSSEDEGGLPGVNVIIKGTTQGTVSDIEGRYSIEVPGSETVLVFSSVGFIQEEMVIGNQSVIDLVMMQDITALDEIVVVGFGTQSRKTVAGSVSQISGEEVIQGKNTSSAVLALQGEVPGLTITRTSSRPGNEGLDIKIRGDISVNGSDPLILLDGLEIPQWQFSTINPNDIANISVLKDGAAAIYGIKAAAGVILVTTKKGSAGKTKVEYRGDFQLNYAFDYPTANLSELADLWLLGGRNDMIDYLDNDGNPQTEGFTGRFFTEDEWQQMADGTFTYAPDPYFFSGDEHRFEDIRQYDYIYGTTLSQRHTVSLSGGNEKARYRTSFGFANDRSPMELVYDGAKRFNIQTNLSYDLSDLVQTEFNVGYDNRMIDAPNQGLGESIGNFEAFPIYNPAGNYYNLWNNNILAKLEEGGRNKEEQEAFRLGVTVNFDLNKYAKGLSFKYQGSFTQRSTLATNRRTQYTVYDWDNNPFTISPGQAGTYVDIDEARVGFQNHVFQGNYKRTVNNHSFAIMIGAIAEQKQTNEYGLYRANMASNDLDDINTGDPTTWKNSGGSEAIGLLSYIARINYDYKDMFILEGLARRDGSSQLDPDYRWKDFYSGMAAWRISQMSFMKSSSFINELKLRASYGEMGSLTGIGAYDYISGINTGASTYFGVSPSLYGTARIASMTTTDRTWERVATSNIGLDFSVIDSKLSGTFEYFHRQNNDMLIPITYPQVLGATAPKTNSGDFSTKGWELSLNWRDKIGDWTYHIGAAIWDSKSEVTRMDGAVNINRGENAIVEGYPLKSLFVFKTDGYLQNEEEVVAYYNQLGFENESDQTVMKAGTLLPTYRSKDKLTPGSVRRVDVSGPDGVPDGIITDDDLVFYGDANPHYSFNLNLGLDWKGFDFRAFFQGVADVNILRTGTLGYPFRRWWNNQNNTYIDRSWTPDNTNADFPIIHYNGPRKAWNYDHRNDVNVVKASYVRAKVISLGYTIPISVMEKLKMGRTRISVSGNDLFTISNVKDGLDPEADNDQTNGDIYPYNSSLMFSIEATF